MNNGFVFVFFFFNGGFLVKFVDWLAFSKILPWPCIPANYLYCFQI